MNKTSFGMTKSGTEAFAYEIANNKGMKAVITDFGATVVSLFVPAKDGKERDVVLGYDNVKAYECGGSYFGAIVGRYANRIAGAKVTIEGEEYPLEANNFENTLHSASNGVSHVLWKVTDYKDNAITLEYFSKEVPMSFPGNATIQVTYEVTENNELAIAYHAEADKTTTFNMTNHCYFNLNGHESGQVLNQTMQINASHFTPVKDGKAIPTGELEAVAETPFDFQVAKPIGRDIKAEHEQLSFGHGYDHNFAIDKTTEGVERVATACCEESGIRMDVLTDAIGIQLYSANFIGGEVGKNNTAYVDNGAFCLETQFFPNAINEPNFETPITQVGDAYETKTLYKFSVQ